MGATALTCYSGTDSITTGLQSSERVMDRQTRESGAPSRCGLGHAMSFDAAIFEETVNSYYQSLYRFAFSLTHSEAQAWDLTQETFRKLATKGHQLSAISKVKTWLFTTLYREFIDGHRRDSRLQPLDEPEQELTSVAAADQAEKFDGVLAREALLRIDPVFRAPLTLFYLQDHTYREIAEILKVPLGTVMSRISRGRALLREMLTERGPAHRQVPKTPESVRG